MKHVRLFAILSLFAAFIAACAAPSAVPSAPEKAKEAIKLKMGWCARTVTSAASPFYISKEMGWWKEENIELELLAFDGSTTCVQQVATGAVDVSLPSVEPIAIGRQPSKGVKTKIFYNAYQGYIYSIAVAADSPIKELKDLKGKNVGVTSMGSAGVVVAKAMVKSVGLDPEKDITLVVANEGAQSAAMVSGKQVDALAQFDTQYALIENAGVKLRLLPAPEFESFPSNGLTATDDWIAKNEQAAIALGRIYAKGTIFAITNPEAAVKIFWKQNPSVKPTGKTEEQALKDDVNVLKARAANWQLAKGGVTKWGESNVKSFESYLKFLQGLGTITEPVKVDDVITNQFIDKINSFDVKKVQDAAKAWTGN